VQICVDPAFTVFSMKGNWATLIAGATMDAAGNLYGTAYRGGFTQQGTVFKLTRVASGWHYSTL
jgi:uncharacterized repeat protein (TIGR03803 family)